MKDIYCTSCSEPIETGYAVNPENSAICNTCYDEAVRESGLENY